MERLLPFGLCLAALALWLAPTAEAVYLLKDFTPVLEEATHLNAALVGLPSEESDRQHKELVYKFMRRTGHPNQYYEALVRVAGVFRDKAYAFLEESQSSGNNQGGFWGSLIGKFNSPMGSLRALCKAEPYFVALVDRYESSAKTGMVSREDVDCDLVRYQAKGMHDILFVLETAVKTLLLEPQPIVNRAIYEELKSHKFESANNFYDIGKLSERQKHLLLQFIKSLAAIKQGLAKPAEPQLGQVIDQFYQPSRFINGRLLDTCQQAMQFQSDLRTLEQSYDSVCEKSTLDPMGRLFKNRYPFDRYGKLAEFCNQFFDALA